KDPQFVGRINRVLISPDVIQARGTLYYFASQGFPLAARLGLYYDEKNHILYYPDGDSYPARLEAISREWKLDGMLPRSVGGLLSWEEYTRIIDEENRIAFAEKSNFWVHMHDIDVHSLDWVLAAEAMPILRQRIRFERAALKTVEE